MAELDVEGLENAVDKAAGGLRCNYTGGERWKIWNSGFSEQLASEQNIIPADQSGYVDHKGRPQAVGFWNQYDGHGKEQGSEFATVLCTLQLEVYYRYLPSYDTTKLIKENVPVKNDDITIEVIL